ncbi:MAG: hypothetical protein WCZ18_04670, partial [Ottowia sp.]
LNAQRSTLNAQRSTLNAQRSTLNAQRSTLNAQRSTLNAHPVSRPSLPTGLCVACARLRTAGGCREAGTNRIQTITAENKFARRRRWRRAFCDRCGPLRKRPIKQHVTSAAAVAGRSAANFGCSRRHRLEQVLLTRWYCIYFYDSVNYARLVRF